MVETGRNRIPFFASAGKTRFIEGNRNHRPESPSQSCVQGGPVRASLSIIAVVCLVSGLCAAPVETIDLASSSAWTVSIDGGGSQTVAVPGNTRMSDNAVFRRGITIPASAAGNVVKVLFGAVDYGCDVYLGTTLITSHKNLMIPFEADLTGKVTAGGSYTLEVRAYSRSHYGNQIPNGCWWASLATGINRYVKLVVLPQIYVKDVYIQPSVTHDRLDFDVWVHNASAQAKTLTVNGSLAAWGASTWTYPSIPAASATIAANGIAKVRMSAPWDLGPQSYWWPNIPFQETYTAVLHNLLLSVKEGAATLDTIIKRFGFAEWGEGPYYTRRHK
jgi:beta-galactosidase/beta-glucuronidase